MPRKYEGKSVPQLVSIYNSDPEEVQEELTYRDPAMVQRFASNLPEICKDHCGEIEVDDDGNERCAYCHMA